MLEKAQTWRELLRQLISKPGERERFAQALKVHPITLTRWIQGNALPHSDNLQRLVQACPSKYRDEMSRLLAQEPVGFVPQIVLDSNQQVEMIPSEVYAEILASHALMNYKQRQWTICERLLSAMLLQLDPNESGMGIVILGCTTPAERKPVRSLRLLQGQGTGPWSSPSKNRPLFLVGIESLSGYAVAVNHVVYLERVDKGLFPALQQPNISSAIACPIRADEKSAGSLYVCSVQPEAFTPIQISLVEAYANLLALEFSEEDFYEHSRIALGFLPPQEVQASSFLTFRERVEQLIIHAASKGQSLSVSQAERLVWQQLEEEMIQLMQTIPPEKLSA